MAVLISSSEEEEDAEEECLPGPSDRRRPPRRRKSAPLEELQEAEEWKLFDSDWRQGLDWRGRRESPKKRYDYRKRVSGVFEEPQSADEDEDDLRDFVVEEGDGGEESSSSSGSGESGSGGDGMVDEIDREGARSARRRSLVLESDEEGSEGAPKRGKGRPADEDNDKRRRWSDQFGSDDDAPPPPAEEPVRRRAVASGSRRESRLSPEQAKRRRFDDNFGSDDSLPSLSVADDGDSGDDGDEVVVVKAERGTVVLDDTSSESEGFVPARRERPGMRFARMAAEEKEEGSVWSHDSSD